MGIVIHFECIECGYNSGELDVGMGFMKQTQKHPFIPCVCPQCEDFKLHQVDELTWEENPKLAWASRIGSPVCQICDSKMLIFELFNIFLFITPHEILKKNKDVNYYHSHLNKLLKEKYKCVKCKNETMKIFHDGYWD